MPENDKAPNFIEGASANQTSKMSNCCEHFDAKTASTCALCKAPICMNCSEIVENNKICIECYVKVLEEQMEQGASPKDIPLALLGGLLGALLGAALWVAVYVLTHIMLGIAAIGVGYLAGQGVSILVGRRKALFLQVISAVFALLGVLLGQMGINVYMGVQYLFKEFSVAINYFNLDVWSLVLKDLPNELGVWGWIFMAIAVYYSWRISAPLVEHKHPQN